MQECKKEIEMLYGIHFGDKINGYYTPNETREASIVISENESDESIIFKLIASDFLMKDARYIVLDNGPRIHIHYVSKDTTQIALILLYEEDF